MKIGLIDVDGHAKKKKWGASLYPNLALRKIGIQLPDEIRQLTLNFDDEI